MITLERPVGTIEGVQVFRDHADPDQFWYVSDRPRIAVVDGEPEFVFVKYQEAFTRTLTEQEQQNLGGGIVAFTVDLRVDEDVLDDIRAELRRHSEGRPSLSPLVYESGTVRLSAMKDRSDDPEANAAAAAVGSELFEEVWGSSVPSLVGANRATFGVRLSHDMAAAFEASLTTGVGFIGVVYDMVFSAMRPAYEVVVRADYDRVYQAFEGQLAGQGLIGPVLLQAQVDLAFTRLEERGAITVDITDFGSEGAAEQAAQWARGMITEDFFSATISPPALLATESPSTPLQQAVTLLGEFGERLQRDTVDSPVRARPAPGGDEAPARQNDVVTNSSVAGGGDGGADTSSLAPGDEEQDEPERDARPALDDVTGAAEEGGDDVPVRPSADGGAPAGRGANSSMFPVSVGLRLRFLRMEERRTRVFDMRKREAVQRRVAPAGLIMDVGDGMSLADNIVTVDSSNFDFIRRLDLQVDSLTDWDALEVKATETLIEYPGERPSGAAPLKAGTVGFQRGDEGPLFFQEFVDEDRNLTYRYRTDVRFGVDAEWIGQDVVHRGRWQTGMGSGQLMIDAQDVLNPLQVVIAADRDMWDTVRESVVDFAYRDELNGWGHRDSFTLDPQHDERTLSLRLTDPSARTYSLQVRHVLRDGSVVAMSGTVAGLTEDGAVDLDALDAAKVVVPAPYARLRYVTVHPPFFSDLSEGTAVLRYTDPTGTLGEQERRVTFNAAQRAEWQDVEVAFAVFGEAPEPWRDPVMGEVRVEVVGRDQAGVLVRRDPVVVAGSSVEL